MAEFKNLKLSTVSISDQQTEDDTDLEYDDVYTSGEIPNKKKRRKSSNTSTKIKKQNSQYEPLEKHKKQKKTIFIVCFALWTLIIIAATLFLLYYFNVFDVPGLDDPFNTTTQAPLPIDISPSISPSLPPTINTTNPTPKPTQLPTTMILRRGNEIYDQGITMNFPPNAFPDSILTITINSANENIKQIFKDTTSVFKAMDITDITDNVIHFVVENDPLNLVPNITYKTNIPIANDLLEQCPDGFGYEIFTIIYQMEYGDNIFPIFVLFPSVYTPTTQTLTTYLYPQMFNNKTADIVLSCTPGINIVPHSRRLLQSDYAGNQRYQTECKASEIICPIENGKCITLNPFSRAHNGVDYASGVRINNILEPFNIIAVANGIIERSEDSTTYGHVIVLRNEDGSATLYGGLLRRYKFIGNEVTKGDIIGLGDRDGHLHFEYIPNGEIYQTKARINPNDCFPPPPAPTMAGDEPTFKPTKSPLVPPNTYKPTPSPTLPTGSITVRDSGALADDSFAVYIDEFKVCETEIGALNTCPINFLRSGVHVLTLEVVEAPDEFGTFYVELSDGLEFNDGTTSKDAIKDYSELTPGVGWTGSWNFTVP